MPKAQNKQTQEKNTRHIMRTRSQDNLHEEDLSAALSNSGSNFHGFPDASLHEQQNVASATNVDTPLTRGAEFEVGLQRNRLQLPVATNATGTENRVESPMSQFSNHREKPASEQSYESYNSYIQTPFGEGIGTTHTSYGRAREVNFPNQPTIEFMNNHLDFN